MLSCPVLTTPACDAKPKLNQAQPGRVKSSQTMFVLFVCLVCLSGLYHLVNLSVCLSVCLAVCLSVCQSVSQSISQSISNLCDCMSVGLSVCLPACLPAYTVCPNYALLSLSSRCPPFLCRTVTYPTKHPNNNKQQPAIQTTKPTNQANKTNKPGN